MAHGRSWAVTAACTACYFRPVVNTSNHWIGLDQSITVNTFSDANMVYPFEVYSWDGLYSVPRTNQPIPLKTLSSCYFGYVAGRY